MYGLVNKAIEGMVTSEFGEGAWTSIKQRAGIDVESFISMDSYPDDVTYRLVQAGSEVLHLETDEILRRFGEYWVLFTSREGYGSLLAMAGDNLKDVLGNLDNLHARVGLSFPDLKPPSFECEELDDGNLLLRYSSHRPGLGPMVVGLLNGLAKMFDTPVEVQQTAFRTDGANCDEFLIKMV